MRSIARFMILALFVAILSETAAAQNADDIAEKYLAAIGGRSALAKLKSRHLTGNVTVATPVGNISGSVETFNQSPNKSRTLIKLDLSAMGMGQATIDQRFDGDSGYSMDSLQGNREITGSQLDNLKNTIFPTPFLDYKQRGATLEFIRQDKLGERNTNVVLLKPKTGSPLQAFIDAETNLLLRTIINVTVPQLGTEVQQTSDFSDYRDVDGVKVAFQVKNSSSIQTISVTAAKVEHNVDIDSTMFAKPGNR